MDKVKLSKSSISILEKEAVLKVLEKEYLGMGEEVKLFEEKIKIYLNTPMSVVCVNTGTAALHLALNALGLKKGDEVLVPSITYIASFQAISATGATPIACDINPHTLFIDTDNARLRITPNTKAIMPVHYASSSKGMEDIYNLAKEFGLRVVEDAAQAFGSERNGLAIGMKGDIICFSFDGIKNITSGEGGAVLSNDQTLIRNIQDARLLGVENDTEKRYTSQRSWDFDVKEQGYRYHMSNIMAAIGIVQLDRLDNFKQKRRQIAETYLKELENIPQINFLDFSYEEILPHIFVVKADDRDRLREYLFLNNIECGIHYKPNHLLKKFKTSYILPASEQAYKEILTLPCYYDLSTDQQEYVIKTIKAFYAQ